MNRGKTTNHRDMSGHLDVGWLLVVDLLLAAQLDKSVVHINEQGLKMQKDHRMTSYHVYY